MQVYLDNDNHMAIKVLHNVYLQRMCYGILKQVIYVINFDLVVLFIMYVVIKIILGCGVAATY